jgi:hypothetical protein
MLHLTIHGIKDLLLTVPPLFEHSMPIHPQLSDREHCDGGRSGGIPEFSARGPTEDNFQMSKQVHY